MYYAYDPASNLTRMKDGHGHTYFSYDALNRLIAEDGPNNNRVYYEYNSLSDRTWMEDPSGHPVYYHYDPLQRMTAAVRDDEGQQRSAYYAYDPASRMTLKRGRGRSLHW